MFTAECDYNQIYDWFQGSQFEQMFFFVSSYDYKDIAISQAVVDNAVRIDRITGNRICYLHFCENTTTISPDMQTQQPLVCRAINQERLMDDVGLTASIKVADQVCERYHILRFNLPAFIMIDKQDNCSIYSVNDYEDFERILSPINLINDFLQDKEALPANNYTDAVENLRWQYSVQLDRMLDSSSGYSFLKRAEEQYGSVLPDVFDVVKNQRSRLDSIISHIEAAVKEYKYDVFISCKSEDYSKAHELQDFLKTSGHNPFLADTSLREIGIDKYTLVIGHVLDACDSFILFSSKPEYATSSYVTAEWSFFINEVNSGRKARGKVVNVLTPDFDIRHLSPWLRDKQCFTTDNYKALLLDYLDASEKEKIEPRQSSRLLDAIRKVFR